MNYYINGKECSRKKYGRWFEENIGVNDYDIVSVINNVHVVYYDTVLNMIRSFRETNCEKIKQSIIDDGFEVDDYTFDTRTNQEGQKVFVTTTATRNI